MKNKVWENPTVTTLNAKETMEEMMPIDGKCPICDSGWHHGRPCKS